MAEMVRLITQRGPKVDEIAREIGVYKETVRYWYGKLLKNGFTIQASRNHEKLGMKRVVAVVELGDSFKEYSDALMFAMGELTYIVTFAKTLPDGLFILNASVPRECLQDWADFMQELRSMGIFKSLDYIFLDWIRNVPMWADWFNFDTCTWEFDWNNEMVNPYTPSAALDQRLPYDDVDLAIIEQLQTDASLPLTEMCRNVGADNYKTFDWHYRHHVLERGLIKSYIANWAGIKYDSTAEKLTHRRHRYMWIDVLANGITDGERMNLMTRFNKTPFVWLEGCGSGTYFARLAFPAEMMPEALELMESAVSMVRNKVKWFHLDQAHALWFSLPRSRYDQNGQRWTFNKEELTVRFQTLVQKIGQRMT